MSGESNASRHEVRSSQYPYDMAGWLSEKSEFATASAARLIEIIREDPTISPDTRERLETSLAHMLHNLTKVLSFATGGPWDTSDASLVFRRGRSGFEEVCVRYGLLPETTEEGARRKVLQVVDELDQLLEMDRGYARPQIHELLAQAPSDPLGLLNDLADSTEAVSQGNLSWKAYLDRARKLIAAIRSSLEVRPGDGVANREVPETTTDHSGDDPSAPSS